MDRNSNKDTFDRSHEDGVNDSRICSETSVTKGKFMKTRRKGSGPRMGNPTKSD